MLWHVNHTFMVYTLNLYSDVCLFSLNETGGKMPWHIAKFPSPNLFPYYYFILSNVKIFFFSLIEVSLIYNVVLVSGVQQSDSVVYTYISIFVHILFPYWLLQSTEYSSLC